MREVARTDLSPGKELLGDDKEAAFMAKKKKKADKPKLDLTIEQAMEELDEIVGALESGQESLSESLGRFERGMSLLRHCHHQLDGAAQRIEILTGITADGEISSEPFDGRATARKAIESQSDHEENSLF